MPLKTPLHRLLSPRSIVFVGGSECEVAIRQTLRLGYDGKIFAVNPKRADLGGFPCLRTIADLPVSPDAAFVAVKRDLAAGIARREAKTINLRISSPFPSSSVSSTHRV